MEINLEASFDENSEGTKLQNRAIQGMIKSLDEGRDGFLYGPTGVGKSRMFSMVAGDRAMKGERVIVLSHRQNLVTQGEKNMDKWVTDPIETTTGMNGTINQTGQVVYSTVQTASDKKQKLEHYDVAIVDEAHHATTDNEEYRDALKALIAANPNIRFIGASATPPEEYEGLHPRFKNADKHVITFDEAIATNLVRLPETRVPDMLYTDHSRLDDVVATHRKNTKSADFEDGIRKTVKGMRGDDWPEQLVSMYDRHLKDQKKTIAFFDSINDANAFIAEAKLSKIPVAALHSGQSTADNTRLKADFEKGKLRILASVNMIAEGYDIDCDGILLDKKTTTVTEYKQILGRGSRGRGDEHGPRAILVDTGASTHMHGNIEAQARMQSVRAALEAGARGSESLLPDSPSQDFRPWVEMKVPGSERSVWATNLSGAIVYAAPTDAGYATFLSKEGKKGHQVDLLKIDGQPNGMPSREALGEWVSGEVLRNESKLSKLISPRRNAPSKLQEMVNRDWEKNARSIDLKIGVLMQYAPTMRQQAHIHSQRQASL